MKHAHTRAGLQSLGITFFTIAMLATAPVYAASTLGSASAPNTTPSNVSPNGKIVPLHTDGPNFVNAQGQPVRFWGVNTAALYPTHEQADHIAANLASLGVNIVRPHHMLRPSSDWVVRSHILSLQTYKGNSQTPDKEAWDRYDYLNAQYYKHGIYLMLSINSTRHYLPGDVDVLKTNDADRKAWMAAVKELNGWNWRKSIDVRKMLPSVDERSVALEIEFAKELLNHKNPYLGMTYAQDPQVLTLEAVNESSTEYAIVCGNRFPEYWQKKLVAKWDAYCAAHGHPNPGDIYKPKTAELKALRAAFCRSLDEAYFAKLKAVIRSTGSHAALTYSNLWRGDNMLAMHAKTADYIENHSYANPDVAANAKDLFLEVAKAQVADKPFIVGELNESESSAAMRRQGPMRTMLPLAAAAYGSLQNWSGVVWFAWIHGDRYLGDDGWAIDETRRPNLGVMLSDGMMLDHLRTTSFIFRHHLIAASTSPITLHVDDPYAAGDYGSLMRGEYTIHPGWQSIHGIRKDFVAAGSGKTQDKNAKWLTTSPSSPLMSDTGEITKDITRNQLTITAPKVAPQVEAFSGKLDGKPPAKLTHLKLSSTSGVFATVILVATDHQPLAQSQHLLISRTGIGKGNQEIAGPTVTLTGLAQKAGYVWQIALKRPRQAADLFRAFTGNKWITLQSMKDGSITLPAGAWHECELRLQRLGTRG